MLGKTTTEDLIECRPTFYKVSREKVTQKKTIKKACFVIAVVYILLEIVALLILEPLFRNKRFMLDEMTSQNASKFTIFLDYENPNIFFSVFHFELLSI